MQIMQTRLRGEEELDQRFREMLAEFMSEMTPEQRLRGLPAEERLRGLPAEERLRGLPAEERLRGLSADDLRRISAAAEQRLRELLDPADSKPHS
jgi:hypothetical protein